MQQRELYCSILVILWATRTDPYPQHSTHSQSWYLPQALQQDRSKLKQKRLKDSLDKTRCYTVDL